MSRNKLRRICLSFRRGLLAHQSSTYMCGVVSFPLTGFLASIGVETRVLESDLGECNHLFLEMQDGMIIDATADQFNYAEKKYPEVYIGPPLDIHKEANPWPGKYAREDAGRAK